MNPIAIYARYSTDNQNPKSVEDQIDACKNYIKQQNWHFSDLKIFHDSAISGTVFNRPGLQALLHFVSTVNNTTVVTESLDRLSRSLRDSAHLYEVLKENSSKIVTITQGEISLIHIGMAGTMAALFLENMKHQIKRGQKAKAQAGLFTSSKCYGYDVVTETCNGRQIRGQRKINTSEAKIVKKIFTDFASGQSAASIAKQLNRKNIPSPSRRYDSKSEWSAGSILGNRKIRSGIISNELYKGVLTYGRTEIRKIDNKKTWTPLPESKWIRVNRPDLSIVSPEIWQKCHERRYTLNKENYHQPSKEGRIHIFSGKLLCGNCKSKAILHWANKYICKAANKNKKCDNFRVITTKMLTEEYLAQLSTLIQSTNWEQIEIASSDNSLNNQLKLQLLSVQTQKSFLIEKIMLGIKDATIDQAVLELQKKEDHLLKVQSLEKDTLLTEKSNCKKSLLHISNCINELSTVLHNHKGLLLFIKSSINNVVYTPKSTRSGVKVDFNFDKIALCLMSNNKEFQKPLKKYLTSSSIL